MNFNFKFALIPIFGWIIFGIASSEENLKFPKDLLIGAASSAYQVEGGWNASGKGENIWDQITHSKPWLVVDKSNGDVACDSFHKYKEDVGILKDIGFDFYRFSISWSRIFPTGFPNIINKEGIKYYSDLIDELQSKSLEPFVTLYHWDHPAIYENFGAWKNELFVDWFADLARVVFQELGHKIKFYATINEPRSFCVGEYENLKKLRAIENTRYEEYLCGHNVLKAHAKVYHMYDKEFKPKQKGKIGIILPCNHYFSKNKNDTLTADIAFQFDCGWIAHPIFSTRGDYPKIMKDRIAENSKIEGWPRSRLPTFTRKEINYIRGTSDYFGLNHYTSRVVIPEEKKIGTGWKDDRGFTVTVEPSWPASASNWLYAVPEGFRAILRKIKEEYGNPPIYITENGYSDRGGLNDSERLKYFYSYMKEMLLARNEGCNVKAYTIWSLLDNFEWIQGYTERFGIVNVDFNDPNRKRTYKNTAKWFKDVLKTRQLLPVKNYT